MISLSCDHPDLEEFIDIKTDLSKVNKANISVRVSDKFMNDVALNNHRSMLTAFLPVKAGQVAADLLKIHQYLTTGSSSSRIFRPAAVLIQLYILRSILISQLTGQIRPTPNRLNLVQLNYSRRLQRSTALAYSRIITRFPLMVFLDFLTSYGMVMSPLSMI